MLKFILTIKRWLFPSKRLKKAKRKLDLAKIHLADLNLKFFKDKQNYMFYQEIKYYTDKIKHLEVKVIKIKEEESNPLMINYHITDSIFGPTLVAINEDKVCAILFGTEPFKTLTKMFSGQNFNEIENNNLISDIIKIINDDIKIENIIFDIAFKCGTKMQQKIWSALNKVEYGSKITYSELAERAGYPKAIRAVATACANNPISVIVPCHRVIPKVGGIGKYRWGIEMKKILIEREVNKI